MIYQLVPGQLQQTSKCITQETECFEETVKFLSQLVSVCNWYPVKIIPIGRVLEACHSLWMQWELSVHDPCCLKVFVMPRTNLSSELLRTYPSGTWKIDHSPAFCGSCLDSWGLFLCFYNTLSSLFLAEQPNSLVHV